MGKYMENESLDVMIGAIVEEEMSKYKLRLKESIQKHFNNPYCAKTEIGNVMYEREIIDVIEKT